MPDLLGVEMNVRGVSELVQSRTNKVGDGPVGGEGVESEKIDELALPMEDAELLRLRDQWEMLYAPYESQLKTRQNRNLAYYLGKQTEGSPKPTDDISIASNLIFEAEETFLPAALAKNPEPVVYSDNTTEGNKISSDVKTMLQYHADVLVLRRKLARMTRQWTIYLLGAVKHGWSEEIDDITLDVRKVQDFIFDPNGAVDEYGDFNSWLGERITVTATKLVELFPEHKEYITVMVDGQMGTEVVYTEWWTDEYCFVTFKDRVLDKHKNEFFNYEKEENDVDGVPAKVPGNNHFARPKKPYTFLSVFSLGEHPHDITGLIEQNIPQQNRISKRTYQIDYNLSKGNNSDVFSEDNFTQETAKQAAGALAKGNPVLVPSGKPIGEAIARLPAPSISEAFFKAQESDMQQLRSSFGTEGISSQAPNEDTTARGMILNQQFDNTRIGGGIGDALEQVADNIFNWQVQLYYVFYDEPHSAAILGNLKATEYVELSSQSLHKRLVVSVAPDSLKPKDEITTMNQALELWGQKAIDIKTLLTILDFPDPQKTAAQAWLFQTNPQLYGQMNFPELTQQIQELMAQQQQGVPSGQPGAPVPGGAPIQPTPEQAPPTLASEPASAALSQVPLPA